MPKRMIDTAIDVMEHLKSEGFEAQVPLCNIIRTLRTYAGGKDDTIKRYLDFLKFVGFIKEAASGEGGKVFDINWRKVDELCLG